MQKNSKITWIFNELLIVCYALIGCHFHFCQADLNKFRLNPNLVGWVFLPHLCWFSLNVKTIKALKLAFFNHDIIVIFWFIADSEQSESWITDAWSVKLTLSLIATFYLPKTKNRTEAPLTQLSYYYFE